MNSPVKHALETSYLSILVNVLLALLKGIVGFFGNSYALIADAIESTADIFASFLVLIGLKVSNKPADANHPYGHGRIEPLITFLVTGFLVASAALISYESILHILTPHKTPKPYTLIVLGAVIIIKEIMYRVVRSKSITTNSSALKADAWHHRSDALTSGAAFIGISIAIICGKGYESADDYAALVAAGVIVYNSYRIFRPALGEMMDEHLYEDMVEQIRTAARAVAGVKDTEKCFVRKTGMNYQVELHAVVDGNISVREGHEIAHRLEDYLKGELPQLGNVVVHVEPEEER